MKGHQTFSDPKNSIPPFEIHGSATEKGIQITAFTSFFFNVVACNWVVRKRVESATKILNLHVYVHVLSEV